MTNKNLTKLEEELRYTFKNKDLLRLSLIHKSYGNEHAEYKGKSNEKLELLGDAVLDLIIAEYIYNRYRSANEGILAKIKAMVVSEPVLAGISRKLKIGEYLRMGKGEEKTGGREKNSLLCDVFEAVLGAIFMDSNYTTARDYVMYHMKDTVENIESDEETVDYKTILQEYCQHKFMTVPTYAVLSEEGPSHKKNFEIGVGILNGVIASKIAKEEIVKLVTNAQYNAKGQGTNKKTAEQMAAKALCEMLGVHRNETL